MKIILIMFGLTFLSGCSEESMNTLIKGLEGVTSVANTVEDYKAKKAQRAYIERQQ